MHEQEATEFCGYDPPIASAPLYLQVVTKPIEFEQQQQGMSVQQTTSQSTQRAPSPPIPIPQMTAGFWEEDDHVEDEILPAMRCSARGHTTFESFEDMVDNNHRILQLMIRVHKLESRLSFLERAHTESSKNRPQFLSQPLHRRSYSY